MTGCKTRTVLPELPFIQFNQGETQDFFSPSTLIQMANCPKGQLYMIGQVTFLDEYEYHRNIHFVKQASGHWHVEIHEYSSPSPTPNGNSTIECSYNITDNAISLRETSQNQVKFLDLPTSQELGARIEFDVSGKEGPQTLETSVSAFKDGNGDWQVRLIGVDDISIGIVTAHWNLENGIHVEHDSTKDRIIIDLWK